MKVGNLYMVKNPSGISAWEYPDLSYGILEFAAFDVISQNEIILVVKMLSNHNRRTSLFDKLKSVIFNNTQPQYSTYVIADRRFQFYYVPESVFANCEVLA